MFIEYSHRNKVIFFRLKYKCLNYKEGGKIAASGFAMKVVVSLLVCAIALAAVASAKVKRATFSLCQMF